MRLVKTIWLSLQTFQVFEKTFFANLLNPQNSIKYLAIPVFIYNGT